MFDGIVPAEARGAKGGGLPSHGIFQGTGSGGRLGSGTYRTYMDLSSDSGLINWLSEYHHFSILKQGRTPNFDGF